MFVPQQWRWDLGDPDLNSNNVFSSLHSCQYLSLVRVYLMNESAVLGCCTRFVSSHKAQKGDPQLDNRYNSGSARLIC